MSVSSSSSRSSWKALSGMLCLTWHTLILSYYMYVIIYRDLMDVSLQLLRAGLVPPNQMNLLRGVLYKVCYLTYWCAFFQIFYFFSCCVADVMEIVGVRSRKIHSLRDWFLCSVAFPIGLMVVAIFWVVWSIDRQLVFPKELDEFFPVWLNHVLHTNVLPILLVDMWLVRHKHPSRTLGISSLLFISALYITWILWLGYGVDIWVYPILRVLSGFKFGLFVAVCALATLPVYLLGEWCISTLHGSSWNKGNRMKKAE